MKFLSLLPKQRLIASLVLLGTPCATMAHPAPEFPFPPHCGDMPYGKSPMFGSKFLPPPLPPIGLMPDFPPPAFDPLPPFLQGIELTESQKDQVFELMHALVPTLREKLKVAGKAMTDLQQLVASGHYGAEKGRALADIQAQAMADVVTMNAQTEAQILALLTDEQRRQWEASRKKRRDD
ncbi:MAG: Spy/CpxP family protein refolding chaperone [Pseudomonadota bacterium]